ncbi:ABC-F family ATP-binding cassette domain-containing protein [Xenorhabdus cabanillasii]|uniref:ABC transporter, duplicated ATPase domain protein n=1 Tax=Xenorhabdus cabanillasii JM26 TaxID=1427517 RepID=W1J567_9GAMM|nr:ABC-F family ATP-binding cassette domain-containing protein [Xenorhabdus cabanillasii]PHM75359.1 ABC transporter ATP-binding protein [Xenorhabdus cabanillasii JM26]CDL84600.1 ABC transporter, duplicated ATPase domain protein [Xenorhabdus cabanillasii JM26]
MSTYLSAQSLSIAFSSAPLFEDITFTLNKGDKIGLIGHNGCGKSTLMKLLSGNLEDYSGKITIASQCVLAYVEQHLPLSLHDATLIEAISEKVKVDEIWRAELLLSELGFPEQDWQTPIGNLSGGQHMRLLLGRAVIQQPDLLLLDEPSNHLDLTSLLWLESFLSQWKGSFVLVSHDQILLDRVTNTTWIMRDKTLYHFGMACSQARQALLERDQTDLQRHASEQKEIDRLEQSAERLATWGKVYDNPDLSRKAKTMLARKQRLAEQQTKLTQGTPWKLTLQGDALPANRLLDIEHMAVMPLGTNVVLFNMLSKQIKSGDRVAVLGNNGCGKSTLLKVLYKEYLEKTLQNVNYHPLCQLGYYDQSLEQIQDDESLSDALIRFAPTSDDQRKRALISAGFEYQRHQQKVASLSGGERARLLFIGLTLARYHLLFLDEPTNHLDLEGKEELFDTLKEYKGGALIVSHDRSLIEQSCNRFWLINKGELTEYHNVEEIYSLLGQGDNLEKPNRQHLTDCNKQESAMVWDEEVLLQRLIELEKLLQEDLSRRPKHQKPALQEEWRQEIEIISRQL